MDRIQILSDVAAAVCGRIGVGPERVDDVVAVLDTQLPAFDENREAVRRPTRNPGSPILTCVQCGARQEAADLMQAAGWAFEEGRWICPRCF